MPKRGHAAMLKGSLPLIFYGLISINKFASLSRNQASLTRIFYYIVKRNFILVSLGSFSIQDDCLHLNLLQVIGSIL